ncbi:MAG: histidinol-phosphate transaminase [Clostridia bacterium]|nr:histidinol-phosphate transaminase [Clostridia bacterium]
MSRFFSDKFSSLAPYVPGEQPKDMQYIKLNTNESPFPPPKSVVEAARVEAQKAQLYSDPECSLLVEKAAETFGVKKTQLLFTNGSDEILNFAFMAFCDPSTPAVFPDITYGFYKVFAALHGVPYREIPLKEDFSIDYRDYLGVNATVFIANPNAPTGMLLGVREIEEILKSNPDHVVVIDEAYVDFGGESCIPLTQKYDNLLVTQTFSKSRSLAGARLGVGIASENLIADLNVIKYSTNPYNVNRMTMAAGYASLCEAEHFSKTCAVIEKNREYTAKKLKEMGFEVLDSKTNFLFARNEKIGGEELYQKLKERGVLVRHFKAERIKDFNRVSIGTLRQMDIFLENVRQILLEIKQ